MEGCEGGLGLWAALTRRGGLSLWGWDDLSMYASGHQPGGAGSHDIWVPRPEPSLLCYMNSSGHVALLILLTWLGQRNKCDISVSPLRHNFMDFEMKD